METTALSPEMCRGWVKGQKQKQKQKMTYPSCLQPLEIMPQRTTAVAVACVNHPGKNNAILHRRSFARATNQSISPDRRRLPLATFPPLYGTTIVPLYCHALPRLRLRGQNSLAASTCPKQPQFQHHLPSASPIRSTRRSHPKARTPDSLTG